MRPVSPQPASRASILVVDDDARNLLAFEVLLASLDADIKLVNSGEAALRELLKRRYDIVLLDVRMPGLDGFATARLTARGPRHRKSSSSARRTTRAAACLPTISCASRSIPTSSSRGCRR